MNVREYLEANEDRTDPTPRWTAPVAYIILFPILAAFLAWNGWIAMLGWNWFVAPIVGTTITLLHALGLVVLIVWVVIPTRERSERTNWEQLTFIGRALRWDAITLVSMYVIHLFV